jgi:hypothetical protein
MKFCHLQVNKWTEVENIILSEVSQVQKAKGHMLFSYVKNTGPTQIQAVLYTHTNLYRTFM